ncbi:hypothetical protein NCTC12673_gp127 [Campylobacter phage NCTC12673]|uniref:Uncharacterized protein n=3 Tax=Fletchervirus TaxID=1636618 RepID=A0AAF0K000_9CAUD|nr:hypothetical protein NCTC12673_gp127 [Campylobacter phage NCTC12673]YP_009321612.1 hypothetical protein BOX06_gp013 [Campylobacter phage PC14]AVR55655.1 hypothetical protein [Campylobacter phage CP39]WGA02400.1 hypothetical protein [Campylobacter phage vB_Cj_QDYZ]AEA86470.1 hypothetical protein [Campylobacter phage NCTC12673]ANH51306.1 hypothetical protein PC14_00013 [Campylobacter phage PC14]
MKEKAEALGKKLDKINDIFNITEKTIVEVEKSDLVKSNPEENLKFTYLKEDFNLMRESLVNTIKRGQDILEVISNNILADPLSSNQAVMAYSTLVDTINNSTKLLTDIYKNIVDIQIKIAPKEAEKGSGKQEIMTIAQITKMISKNQQSQS